MQLKLLNFHKLISNIATNLVGAFVPLIILEATGSIPLAAAGLALQYIIRSVTTLILQKQMCEKPQLMLLIRVVPMILYSIFIFVIETNLWLGAIGLCVFYGLSDSCKRMPLEIILNYSSTEAKEESTGLGLTRLVEQLGVLIAILVGGFLLDVNKTVVVVISIVLYVISCVPLVMYYLKSRKNPLFNKDVVSNAQLTFKKEEKTRTIGQNIILKILVMYGLTYFVYCFVDALTFCYNIHLFVVDGSYGTAGVFSAIYNGAFGLGSYFFGKLNQKKDLQPIVVASAIICAIAVFPIWFVDALWVNYILFGIIGFMYASICLFMFQRLITKSRILGVSNKALFVREITSNVSVIVPVLTGCFGTMIPSFILMAVCFGISAWLIPYNEEKTRTLLVDYLQYNEVVYENKNKRRRMFTAKRKEK